MQIVVVGLVVLAAYLFFFRPLGTDDLIAVALLSAALIYQIILIRPYTPLSRKQVLDADAGNSEHSLNIMIANVKMTNRHWRTLLDIIEASDADIVLLSETDAWWIKQMSPLAHRYPYSVEHPQDNTYGMALYSKRELHNVQVRFLVEADVPSIHGSVNMPAGVSVELHCLHPRPPQLSQSGDTGERDAELVLTARKVKQSDNPVVVMGDLNDVAWSHTSRLFRRISGLLDPRIGRGMYNTFHAGYPLIRFPLDHIFHSNHFTLIQLERKPFFGSDHFPIAARLLYRPEAGFRQETPERKQSDTKEAAQIIREGAAGKKPPL